MKRFLNRAIMFSNYNFKSNLAFGILVLCYLECKARDIKYSDMGFKRRTWLGKKPISKKCNHKHPLIDYN